MDAQEQQMEQALRQLILEIMEKPARERMANLKLVKPQLALQLEMYLGQLHQAGQLRSKITDAQLVSILKKLSEKREIRIKRL